MEITPKALAGTLAIASMVSFTAAAFAQTDESVAASSTPVDAAACGDALDALTAAEIAQIDERTDIQKQMMQARTDALKSVISVEDVQERRTALREALEPVIKEYREQMDALREELTDEREAVKEACGEAGLGMGIGMGMPGRFLMKHGPGHMPEMMKNMMNGSGGVMKNGEGKPMIKLFKDRFDHEKEGKA